MTNSRAARRPWVATDVIMTRVPKSTIRCSFASIFFGRQAIQYNICTNNKKFINTNAYKECRKKNGLFLLLLLLKLPYRPLRRALYGSLECAKLVAEKAESSRAPLSAPRGIGCWHSKLQFTPPDSI